MSEPAERSGIDAGPADREDDFATPVARSRIALLKRLADVVCLPGSRVNSFERSMTADLLVELLREASLDERARVARRLASLSELPPNLSRLLLRDNIKVAGELLEHSQTLSDIDLIECTRTMTLDHRRMIALRRDVSEVVVDALAAASEEAVQEALLRNNQARLGQAALERILGDTRDNPRLIELLLRRPELRPSHAYLMFWWASGDARRAILQRFAVSREVLQDAVSDVFALAAAERWQDPISRKALQFIERRQRNRAAIERSPYDSLDAAVAAAQTGLSRELAEEISYLSGIKPTTGAKILTDPGGEPLAILCKATGLPKSAVRALWRGMRRPETDSTGVITPGLERVLNLYDSLAVDRAQTVLRYWNWAITSALTPALMKAIRDGDASAIDDISTPERTAMMALGADYRR